MVSETRRRYRWRLACDAVEPTRSVYTRFWTRKTQAQRVAQAQGCWVGGLIEDRCTFGFRRLVLEGEIDMPSARVAQECATLVAKWCLYTMYGLNEYGDMQHAPEPPHLDVRVWSPANIP